MDFIDLRTRAELLEICGDLEGAERLRAQSFEIAREVDLTCYAYQLMWRDKIDTAIDLLERGAAAHPHSWNMRHTLGEAYEILGDYAHAAANFRMAISLADNEATIHTVEESLRRVAQFEQVAS